MKGLTRIDVILVFNNEKVFVKQLEKLLQARGREMKYPGVEDVKPLIPVMQCLALLTHSITGTKKLQHKYQLFCIFLIFAINHHIFYCIQIIETIFHIRQQISTFHPFIPSINRNQLRLIRMFVTILFRFL